MCLLFQFHQLNSLFVTVVLGFVLQCLLGFLNKHMAFVGKATLQLPATPLMYWCRHAVCAHAREAAFHWEGSQVVFQIMRGHVFWNQCSPTAVG